MAANASDAIASTSKTASSSASKPAKAANGTGGRTDKKQAAHAAHVKQTTSNAHELAKHVAQQFVAATLDARHIVVIERMFQRETPVCVCLLEGSESCGLSRWMSRDCRLKEVSAKLMLPLARSMGEDQISTETGLQLKEVNKVMHVLVTTGVVCSSVGSLSEPRRAGSTCPQSQPQ